MPTRRDILKTTALGIGSFALPSFAPAVLPSVFIEQAPAKRQFQHSVCRWCFGSIPLEIFAEQVRDLGIASIELLPPAEWKIIQKYGLTCAVGTLPTVSLTEGYNNSANHAKLQQAHLQLIDQAAEAGIPQVIVFSGNRGKISDRQGLENCARGLDKVVKHAQKRGITVIMELLNSKVDHQGYQCDRTSWGVALVDKIGAPNFKLLYDIYHMQIMEGDIIATIRQYKDHIAHFHTAGVPGRHEINNKQELNYRAIMTAIAETGFKGYVAQEFIPTYEDKIAALRESIEICSV